MSQRSWLHRTQQTDYYNNTAEPVLKQFLLNECGMSNLHPKIQGFYHAYSLVSSRAFFVDAYHGLAMVPVADAYVCQLFVSPSNTHKTL